MRISKRQNIVGVINNGKVFAVFRHAAEQKNLTERVGTTNDGRKHHMRHNAETSFVVDGYPNG